MTIISIIYKFTIDGFVVIINEVLFIFEAFSCSSAEACLVRKVL
jgi:hypothetical protein